MRDDSNEKMSVRVGRPADLPEVFQPSRDLFRVFSTVKRRYANVAFALSAETTSGRDDNV